MCARYDDDLTLTIKDGSPFYLSPDIWLSGPNPNVAVPGANTVNVRVTLAPGKPFEASQARAQVYVGNPSLVMSPTTGTVLIGTAAIPKADFPAGGGPVVKQLPWTVVVDPNDPKGPAQPGHRCLIARAYPFGATLPTDFQVPTDQHEGQRNMTIAATAKDGDSTGGAGGGLIGAPEGKPLGPGEDGLWEFRIDTTTEAERGERVTIRATHQTRISRGLMDDLAKRGTGHPFDGLAERRPEKFLLDFDLPEKDLTHFETQVVGDTVKQVELEPPWKPEVGEPTFDERRGRYSVDAELLPGRMARFGFKADLTDTPQGRAQVFHLEQLDAGGKVAGGLALILHMVG